MHTYIQTLGLQVRSIIFYSRCTKQISDFTDASYLMWVIFSGRWYMKTLDLVLAAQNSAIFLDGQMIKRSLQITIL